MGFPFYDIEMDPYYLNIDALIKGMVLFLFYYIIYRTALIGQPNTLCQ